MAQGNPPRDPREASPEEITQQTHPKGLDSAAQPAAVQPADAPSQEPIEPVYVVASRPAAAELEPPKPNFFQRVGRALFNRETRFGRFMRSAATTLATVIILFAAWLVVAYFLLYRPLNDRLTEVQAEATQTAGQLEQARSDLTKAQQDAKTAQAQSGNDRQQLEVEQAHVQLLRAVNQVSAARLALASQDQASAAQSLTDAEKTLSSVYPQLTKKDSRQVDTLQALFTLAKNDLDRDPTLANQDLDRLQSELDLAEKNLVPSDQ